MINYNQVVPQQLSEGFLFCLEGTVNILGWGYSYVFFSDFSSSISILWLGISSSTFCYLNSYISNLSICTLYTPD